MKIQLGKCSVDVRFIAEAKTLSIVFNRNETANTKNINGGIMVGYLTGFAIGTHVAGKIVDGYSILRCGGNRPKIERWQQGKGFRVLYSRKG